MILVIGFSTGCQRSSKPGIYINEFLASNSGLNTDSLNHEHVDWIELYNSYDTIVDIGGYYLTDKKADTTKWTIPLGTKLYIPGYGYGVAADTGGAIKGNKIDLCFNSLSEARKWGRRTITIKIVP